LRWSKIFRFTLGSRILAIKINMWNQELHTHYGVTNETPDGYYIPFWDFDERYTLSDVKETLKAIQDDRHLGSIYIIQTWPKQSYRAIGFDVMDWQFYISTLAYTDYIDWSYLKHSVMRNRAVIRVSQKDGTENKIVGQVYPTEFPLQWRTSPDHEQFFHSIFPHEIPEPEPPMKKIRVRLSKYESFR
jgi:hypothetical protein